MHEAPHSEADNPNRLEIGHRNRLQAKILELATIPARTEAERNARKDWMRDWVDEYRDAMTEIIDGDSEESAIIRAMAERGEYGNAAQAVLDKLGLSPAKAA